MFEIKKLIGPFFSPLPVCVELIVLGLLLLWFTPRQRLGKTIVTIAGLLLVLMTTEGISGRFLNLLEAQYSPLTKSTLELKLAAHGRDSVSWIVVLAGGVTPSPSLPVQLQVSYDSQIRLLEGIRLYKMMPGSKLILTGGLGSPTQSEATLLSQYAQGLGVDKDDMILETRSRDTKDHPVNVGPIVKNDPFILVTSAFHMPRAIKLFSKQGLSPIPAPAGHWTPPNYVWPEYYFPRSQGTRLTELAFHEYLGLTWAWMRGQI